MQYDARRTTNTRKSVVTLAALALALAALGFATQPAAAQQNLLVNGTFESPTTSTFTTGSITGWSGTGDYGLAAYGLFPITAPAGGGNQFAYINSGSIFQNTTTLTAGTTYTFSAQVGRRSDDPSALSSLSLLTSGGTVLATSGPVTPTAGTFALYSVSYTANNPLLYGQTVQVQLANVNTPQQSAFDNASLTTATPEPSGVAAFAFTGLGVAGLLLRARKRKA